MKAELQARNERLRAGLLESGVSPASLAEHLSVDHKTVERWIAGRTPYRRYRFAIAVKLGVEEDYLWPGALRPGNDGVGERNRRHIPAPVGHGA